MSVKIASRSENAFGLRVAFVEELREQNAPRIRSVKPMSYTKRQVQFWHSFRGQSALLVNDGDMSMRSLILYALNEKGLEVTLDDFLRPCMEPEWS